MLFVQCFVFCYSAVNYLSKINKPFQLFSCRFQLLHVLLPRVQLQDCHKHGTRRELKTFMFVLFHNWNNTISVYKYISHALASKAQWQILFAHNNYNVLSRMANRDVTAKQGTNLMKIKLAINGNTVFNKRRF